MKETTDIALSIRTSSEEIEKWDRKRIVNALIRETNVDEHLADDISKDVENRIFSSGIKTITTSLIREVVNSKLLEMGLRKECLKHDRLGVPLYDVEELLVKPNKENANVPHGPEATNLTLAGQIKKEYALRRIFSKDVTEAHLKGDLHLHDLNMPDRPYCSGQSLEYIKKFGLNLPKSLSIAKPAKHAEVLLAHLVKFSASLQCHYAGAIGWDAINVFFAPFLVGADKRRLKQIAQMLIYEFSQQAVARGGQAIFSDINIYYEIPKHFEDTPAIGPGGKYTGKVYKDYEKEAKEFAWALFEVYKEGDGSGRPFMFPKPNLHLTEKFFKTPGHMEFLTHVCEVASKMGNPYFLFDRGSTAKISECCFHNTQKVLVKTSRGIRHGCIGKICREHKDNTIEVLYNGSFKKAKPVIVEYSNFIKIKLHNGYELFVTDNHLCPTLQGDKKAKDLTLNDYFPINNKELKGFNDKNNYNMGYFLGAYLGDGSKNNQKDAENNRITFSLSKVKKTVIDKIIDFAEYFGAHFTVTEENEKHVIFVHITSSSLKALINEFIKGNCALTKKLSNKVYEMSISFRQGLLDGFYDTDGGNRNRSYTFSNDLVYDLNALYTTLGMSLNISEDTRKKEDGKFSDNLGYVLRPYCKHSKYTTRPGFKFFNSKYWFKIKTIERVTYNTPQQAYCFEMEDEENPYFTLANGIETHNCRLSFKLTDQDFSDAKEPWKMRYCAIQNITLNLPRVGLTNTGDKVFDKLTRLFDLSVKAHLQKRRFIKKILSLGNDGPLALLAMSNDNDLYLKLDRVSYLIGMVGLNELVKTQTGFEMHENGKAFKYGLKIIAHLKILTDKASKEHGMHFVLEQTPAESTSHRFARLDIKYYPEKAKKIVQGCVEDDSVYYTNSTHLNISADIDPITRVKKEGVFHPLIEAGAMCLDYNELLPLYNNKFIISKIGDLVENCIKNSNSAPIILPDGSIKVKLSVPLKILGEKNLVDLTHVVKIPIKNKKTYSITTNDRKSINILENHILFKLHKGDIIETYAQNFEPKETIVMQSEVIDNDKINSFDVLDILLKYENEINIIDTDGDIKNYIKNTNNLCIPKSLYRGIINLKLLKNIGYDINKNKYRLRWRYKNSTSKIPFSFKLDYNFGLLLGFLLSDGHVYSNISNYRTGFTFHKKEKVFMDIAVKLFKKYFNTDIRFKNRGNYCQANKGDKSIYFLLDTLNIGKHSFSKKIPNSLFVLKKDYLLGILDGLFCGDGLKSSKNPGYTDISLTSQELISQMQIICSVLGVKYTKTEREPVSRKNRHKVYTICVNRSGFRVVKSMNIYSNYIKIPKIDKREFISKNSSPFEKYYNKYFKGRAYSNIVINRKQLKATKNKIGVCTAVKYSNNWINFLSTVENSNDLLKLINKHKIAFDLNLSVRVVEKILNTNSYIKTVYYSKNTYNRVKFYNIDSFQKDINYDKKFMIKFKNILEKHTFSMIYSIKEICNGHKYAYDITVSGHKFSTLDGILCHNTHIWLGESKPSAESLASFVIKVFKLTKNDQIAFSPEFTCCNKCKKTTRGIKEKCTYCGSNDIEGITRITGYFSKISGWNKGKIAELKNRYKSHI